MIHITYTRLGKTYNWLCCPTLKSLKVWIKALVSLGPISDVRIEVKLCLM